MRKVLFAILLFALSALFIAASAQALTSAIRGKVIDKYTQQPLIGASVSLPGTNPLIGAVTDAQGHFFLDKVPLGRHNIQVVFMGYETVNMSNIELNSGKELVLNIEMEETVIRAGEVTITADKELGKPENELATVSARQLSIENSKRYAGSLNDVSRMAQNFAGVQGANDTRNDLVIRGNSSMGVLYRLEGMDIPNPNHFALLGSSGGPISILNNNVLDNSDFFTGAFPAQYGNAYAGVFDLKMRNGSNTKHEFLGQIGFNGVEGMAEGPFKKGKSASYLFNYRYSTLKALKFLGVFFGTLAVPEYQDISFKLNFPSKKGQTSIFGVGGVSSISFLNEEKGDNDIFVPGTRNLLYGTRLGATGISHTILLNKKSFVRMVLSTQYSANNIVNDTLDQNGENPFNTYRNRSGQGKNSFNVVYQYKFNSRHFIRTGGYFDRLFFKLDERYWSRPAQQYFQQSDYHGATYLLQPFAQWQFKYTTQLVFTAGLHGQYFVLNHKGLVEPRLGMRWQVSDRSAFSAAFGMHSQLPPTSMYFNKVENATGAEMANKNLGFIRSNHYVVGYDLTLNHSTRIKTEAYYQHLYNIPVDANVSSYSVLNQGANFYFNFPDYLVNKGTGQNYGVEFTLERFLHKGFYYLVTASLFSAKYTASDGKTYNTAFNGNYNFTSLAGYEHKLFQQSERLSNWVFTSNARFTLNGGQRYTPFNLTLSRLAGVGVPDQNKTFAERFPDYWRIDARFGLKRNGKRITHELAAEFQNITARKNVFTIQYNPETGKVDQLYQLGFLPVAQYRVYF
ncbi:TonB-dependent receptor plug domain-containing protein [bacterium]|nr:TonB-dependent receptor plug domain-containing protein [bacterium]